MLKGNVLVIGNSGVGKSTLINAVLGEEVTVTGRGTSGTTEELGIYESNEIPFRIIDTIGFEPSFLKELKAVNAVKKWSKSCAKDENNQINAIWFCVDGTSGKLFKKTIENLSRAVSMWKSVPIIVVITKSYAIPEREQNIELVKQAFYKQKLGKNVREIIPVVASAYVINEGVCAPPDGIGELIDATNAILPEGIKAAANDIAEFILKRKRAMAHSLVAISTAAGVTTGAISPPFSDSLILAPVELGEIKAIAKIYGIKSDEKSKKLFEEIITVGTVSIVAKSALGALKAVPVINVAASVLNAAVAGSFVFAIGEASIYIFEQIYLGKKSIEDTEWVTKIIESKLSSEFIEKVTKVFESIAKNPNNKEIAKTIIEIFVSTTK